MKNSSGFILTSVFSVMLSIGSLTDTLNCDSILDSVGIIENDIFAFSSVDKFLAIL